MPEETPKCYAVLTALGQAMVADCIRSGADLNLCWLAVGDAEYTPVESQTALINERARVALSDIVPEPQNPGQLRFTAVLPPDLGGWRIFEAGVLAENGNLFALAKLDGTYKPVYADGFTKEVGLDLILEISSEANVVLKVDPNLITVTWSRLERYLLRAFGLRLTPEMELVADRAENGDSLAEKLYQHRLLLPQASVFTKDRDQRLTALIPY